MKKEDYLNMLRNNTFFQMVLSRATNDEEKRAIKAYTEDFMMKFYKNVFEPIDTMKQDDPDTLKKTYVDAENEIVSKDNKE
jgi:hypothetical protein